MKDTHKRIHRKFRGFNAHGGLCNQKSVNVCEQTE